MRGRTLLLAGFRSSERHGLARDQNRAQSWQGSVAGFASNSFAGQDDQRPGEDLMLYSLLKSSLLFCALTFALPTMAQVEGPAVAVEKAPFHVPVFRNEYVALLNVYIPPGRVAGYHTHSLDQISVLVSDADMVGQVWGEQPGPTRRNPRGNVGFTPYSKKPMTHKVSNVGPTPFNNIVIALVYPELAVSRPVSGQRLRLTRRFSTMSVSEVGAWCSSRASQLRLITQKAPGIRVVIAGGEIVESVSGEAERGMAPKTGEFFWQEAGATRAVRNSGTTRIEFVEFELR
jgi:hypothetical protein